MGEARRRAQAQGQKPVQIKIAPRKRAAGFTLVHHNRVEEQGENGMIYARNIFRVADADGNLMVEETTEGPRPVLVLSVAQPIRRSVLTRV